MSQMSYMDEPVHHQAQEEFIATLSHDLRNPIVAIKMAIDLLREEVMEHHQLEMLELIDRNVDQAQELIHQLLDTHLIKSGAKLPLRIVECDLLRILLKCKQALPPDERQRLHIEVHGDDDIYGFWDPQALERIFKNLLSNAFKFSDSKQPIRITLRQKPEITYFSIQNEGPIISLDHQLRVFESQFRAPRTGEADKKGWGLGLTLVRGLVEAHSGKIEVSSSREEGTVFTIKIPNDSRNRSIS